MKLKKLFAIILVLVISLVPLTSFASQEVLEPDYAGNTDSLIEIKNPESAVSSTTSTSFVISAVAANGTTVTLYTLDSTTGKYVKMYSAEGVALESVVGAAGLYAQNLELTYGTNNIMVVATGADGAVETAKLEITLVKINLIDAIKNIWQSIISQ